MIQNPFNPEIPVVSIDSFFGREKTAEQILSGLKEGRSFGVIGGRKIGKTSLLNYLVKRIEINYNNKTILVPIVVDLHQLTPKNRSAFFKYILLKLKGSLNKQKSLHLFSKGFSIPSMNENEFDLEEILSIFQKIETICLNNWEDFKVVCFIDELEYLESKPYADDLISNLRVMISNHPIRNFISLVVFGDRFLYEMSNIKGSPLENVITVIQLGVMEPDSIVKMVCSALQTTDIPAFVEEICALSGYNPYVVKYFMREVWKKQQTNKVTQDDIYQASQSFLRESSVFKYWYKEFSDLDKQIYFEFTKRIGNNYIRFSTIHLINMFRCDLVEDSINKLFYHGLVWREADNKHHIVPNLFMNWFLNIFSHNRLIKNDPPNKKGNMVMSILDLLTNSTVPAIIKFLFDQLDKITDRKIDRDYKRIDELKKNLEPYKTKNDIKEAELMQIKEDIKELCVKLKENDAGMISREFFQKWSEGKLESKELAIIIKKELEIVINKADDLNININKRRKIEDIADALDLNLRDLEEAKQNKRLGLCKDQEVRNKEIIFRRSLREARNLIKGLI